MNVCCGMLLVTSPVFYLWMCNFHSKLFEWYHSYAGIFVLILYLSTVSLFSSVRWFYFSSFTLDVIPQKQTFTLYILIVIYVSFFAAKPSRLPKSHPVSPAVGSSAWLQSSPPLALGLSPTPTWRERKVWHGLQPSVHEHFILGFI